MVALRTSYVRADCLRPGDRSVLLGTVEEVGVAGPAGMRWVRWLGSEHRHIFPGSQVFTIVERGPVGYPRWFEDEAEILADFNDHEFLTAMATPLAGGRLPGLRAVLHYRALEIQAERRKP